MQQLAVNKATIQSRLNDLGNCVLELEKLSQLSIDDFATNNHNTALASFYLQRAIEDILNIGSHILARLSQPITVNEYKDILPELGKAKIIPHDYVIRNSKLGNYRNRLVHHYLDISPEEIYQIIKIHLKDLTEFGALVDKLLSNPTPFNLIVE